MQPRDARQLLDAAAPDFRGKQTCKKPAHPFVGRGEEPVDRPMFARGRTTRSLLAD